MEAMWDVVDDLASSAFMALLSGYCPAGVDLFATFAASKLVSPRIWLPVDVLTE